MSVDQLAIRSALLPRVRTFVFKVASRCNLNCSYCYVYHKGDSTWRDRPTLMSSEVANSAIARIAEFADAHALADVRITFHGGEPTLFGAERLDQLCKLIRKRLGPRRVRFAMQTNATLIDDAWIPVLAAHEVHVGVSIDGPESQHDKMRVDHVGRGSFARMATGVRRLKSAGLHIGALCVIPFGADPLAVHVAIENLGFRAIDYLFPDMSASEHAAATRLFGPRPVADFLLPILELWWRERTMEPRVGVFHQVAQLILGGSSTTDTFGGGSQPYVFIEADGALEGLDVLRTCENGASSSGLRVQDHSIDDYLRHGGLPSMAARGEIARPTSCIACPEYDTCGGGYLPHRFRRDQAASVAACFDHASVWCADILALFGRMRELLEVGPAETLQRSSALSALRRRGGAS